MFFLATKNLFQEKTRFVISVGGVTFSVLLIILLVALYQGWKMRMGEYIRQLPADLWIAQKGARDMFHSISIIKAEDIQKVREINGVTQTATFVGKQLELEIDGKEALTFLVGYDPSERIGGPLKVIRGKETPQNGEIIIDSVFSDNYNLKIGDYLPVANQSFKIVGIAEGGNLILYQYSFITKEDAQKVFRLDGRASYFLVKVDSPSQKTAIGQQIESALDYTESLTKERFIENNTQLVTETFLPIIMVLVLIGFGVGIAVIGLTIFTSTVEKSKEYGIIKAIGVNNFQLYLIVIEQAVISGVVGFFAGSLIALLLNQIVGRFVPEFITKFRIFDFGWIFAATIIMSIVAAFLPIRRLARINPAEAFKS